jgi:hypothetical protein
MSRNKTLLNERTLRRWGKLANMAPITETWLDEQGEDADIGAAGEDEIAAGEAEMEAGEEVEASAEENEAVEQIVMAVVDAIAQETGVEIEVAGGAEGAEGDEAAMDDMDAGMDASDELDDDADAEMDAAANRRAYNRTDEEKDMNKAGKKDDDTEDESLAADGKESSKEQSMKDRRKESRGAKNETLNIEVIDDDHLTEAVLRRVVERLLKRK